MKAKGLADPNPYKLKGKQLKVIDRTPKRNNTSNLSLFKLIVFIYNVLCLSKQIYVVLHHDKTSLKNEIISFPT